MKSVSLSRVRILRLGRLMAMVHLFVFLLLAGSPAGAQGDEDSIGQLFNKAVVGMGQGKWKPARDVLQKVTSEFGGNGAYEAYGPKFGVIYYNKGICELKLRMFSEAASSFQTCFEKYPDRGGDSGDAENKNIYWKRSVFQWAAALQYGENYEEAIKRYKQFLSLKPEAGNFNVGAYYLNLGVCYAKTEDLKNATVNISKAFDNVSKFKATPEGLWQGFLALADLWVSGDEKAAAEGFAFIAKYKQQLDQPGYRLSQFTGQLLRLGQGAESAGKPELALQFFALVPKTEDAIMAAKADYGRMPTRVAQIVEKLEKQLSSGDPAEVNAYFGIAKAHDQMNNKRAGFVIYEELANHYLKSKSRPEILYAATATASVVREMLKAQTFGMTFLKEFPDHELADDVASLLLSSLFYNQEYEKCIDIAAKIRKTLKVGSKDRDLPDFVYGGSLYYLGRYEEAQPELDSHVKNYETSPYKENSSFYQASNLTKQYRWKEASVKLDAWLKVYEPRKSALLDVAFLDRANCYFAMANSENGGNDKALSLISRIEKQFPDSEVLDRALNLRGDVYQNMRQLPDAEKSYLAGLRIAEERDHPETAAGGLAQLVPVCNAQKKYKEAIGYYDHFFRDFPETSYAPNVAVFGLPSFKNGNPGRLTEATGRLEKLIVTLAELGDSAGLEKAVNSYASFHLEEMKEKPDEVIARLDKRFPNERGLRSLQAWLLIAKIGIIEKRLKERSDSAARLRVYYRQFESAYDKKDLGNFILARVGVNIAEANDFKAKPWFEEILRRDNPEFKDLALLELAKINAKSADPKLKAESANAFRRVREDYQNPQLREDATLGLGRLYHEGGEWPKANAEWKTYMGSRTYNKARTEVAFKMAESYEKMNQVDNAVKAYFNVYALHAPKLDYSAEAVLRLTRIQWDRGKKAEAYKILTEAFVRMRKNDHPKVQALKVKSSEWKAALKQSGDLTPELEELSKQAG